MAYFPAFIKLDNLKILIIGGGNIACEKCDHLLDFTKNIEVIALDCNAQMKKLIDDNNLKYSQRGYKEGDVKDFNIIITAIDDIQLQKEIFFETKQYPNCQCNSVDSPKYCDFIFPSYIKKGDLTIAVSTSGSSPALAKHLRKHLQRLIPDSIVDFLIEMKGYRSSMKKGKERMEFLDKKTIDYISTWND